MSKAEAPVVDARVVDALDVRTVTVPGDARRARADRVVADLTGLSRSYVQRLISQGHLTAQGPAAEAAQAVKANTVVEPGTRLRLEVPPPEDARPQPEPGIAVTVVYEDDDLLIVDKPAGLVVHPSAGHAAGTLVNALLGRNGPEAFGGIAGVRRPGIVHRLDRDTSGLLMVARNDTAQASLM
ncbi:MAG TPA: RluA family pseudouridine synthase, partial [Candidatus Eisenbacteria bacterium]|nr:RluA family pseudouridine synthase [Candidatus Eisenbacteria bacterium]